MSKKPNYSKYNLPILKHICEENGYEIEKKSEDQYRIYGATCVIDFWIARMVYHKVSGETIKAKEPYYRGLEWLCSEEQVKHLLLTGEFK